MTSSANEMRDQIAMLQTRLSKLFEEFRTVASRTNVDNLEQAMKGAGAKENTIAEHITSLNRAIGSTNEMLNEVLVEVGSAAHVVDAAVRKTNRDNSRGGLTNLYF